jgi:hypothetical protein
MTCDELRARIEDLKKRLDDVVPAYEKALANPLDEASWDAACWAADINEGGDLRMAIVAAKYEARF